MHTIRLSGRRFLPARILRDDSPADLLQEKTGEPIDDFRSSNLIVNPDLWERLCDSCVEPLVGQAFDVDAEFDLLRYLINRNKAISRVTAPMPRDPRAARPSLD
jgi:hypothetical protein